MDRTNNRSPLTRSTSVPDLRNSPQTEPSTKPGKLLTNPLSKPDDSKLPDPPPIGTTPPPKPGNTGPAPHVTVQQVVHSRAEQEHDMDRVTSRLAAMPSYKPTLTDEVEQQEFWSRLAELDMNMAERTGTPAEQQAAKAALERIHVRIGAATEAVLTDVASRYIDPAKADPRQLEDDLAKLRKIRSSLNTDQEAATRYQIGVTSPTDPPLPRSSSPVAERHGQLKERVGLEVIRLAEMQSQITEEEARKRREGNSPKPPPVPPTSDTPEPWSRERLESDLQAWKDQQPVGPPKSPPPPVPLVAPPLVTPNDQEELVVSSIDADEPPIVIHQQVPETREEPPVLTRSIQTESQAVAEPLQVEVVNIEEMTIVPELVATVQDVSIDMPAEDLKAQASNLMMSTLSGPTTEEEYNKYLQEELGMTAEDIGGLPFAAKKEHADQMTWSAPASKL